MGGADDALAAAAALRIEDLPGSGWVAAPDEDDGAAGDDAGASGGDAADELLEGALDGFPDGAVVASATSPRFTRGDAIAWSVTWVLSSAEAASLAAAHLAGTPFARSFVDSVAATLEPDPAALDDGPGLAGSAGSAGPGEMAGSTGPPLPDGPEEPPRPGGSPGSTRPGGSAEPDGPVGSVAAGEAGGGGHAGAGSGGTTPPEDDGPFVLGAVTDAPQAVPGVPGGVHHRARVTAGTGEGALVVHLHLVVVSGPQATTLLVLGDSPSAPSDSLVATAAATLARRVTG